MSDEITKTAAPTQWKWVIIGVVAGVVIIVMGLHFLGVFRIGLLHRQARMEVRNHPAGPLGSYLVGLAFAIELEFLHGREKLRGYDVLSLLKY